ncbi:hypothetical protein QA639_21040 [Bradyrhizobium pachyrhizi]|uniref:hypothetical protein n=1 Tax=Bradyrhizobium pachyrhizi TaxID=280333 RepID=UPI0024B19352|nr:hypothetical protein [Bradyrhizobium pachyrhizi]WFU52196.1 hypothetical protein QA639_21040 [Bradyrhizobium pachyrhizi]
MANVVEGEPRDSREWAGSYLDEGGIIADIVKRVSADAEAVRRWLDPQSWKLPLLPGGRIDPDAPDHAGCLKFAGMSIRNFYGMWHASNPHTVFGIDDDVEMTDGIVTDARHPDNMSGRIIAAVKAELQKMAPVAA